MLTESLAIEMQTDLLHLLMEVKSANPECGCQDPNHVSRYIGLILMQGVKGAYVSKFSGLNITDVTNLIFQCVFQPCENKSMRLVLFGLPPTLSLRNSTLECTKDGLLSQAGRLTVSL